MRQFSDETMKPEQTIKFTLTTHEKHKELNELKPFSCEITIKFYEHGDNEYSCVVNQFDVIVVNGTKENTLEKLRTYLDQAMQRRRECAISRGFEYFEYKLTDWVPSDDEALFKHADVRAALNIN